MSKGINTANRFKEVELIKEASIEMSHQKSPKPHLSSYMKGKQSQSQSLNKT